MIQSRQSRFSENHADRCLLRSTDDPQLTANVPAAVQLVGRRWRDEELLGLGEIVSDLCGSKNWKQQ